MPTSDGKVQVDIVANKKPFEQGLKSLDGVAGKIGGRIAALFSVAALGAFGKQCVELASDLNEVQNVVDVTFSSMSGKVDEWARSAADRFGLSETMAKRYVGTFGSMAEAFGFTEQQAYKMSTALTGLAGDVASFYNITQDEAYTKLKSVFSGETESLKELGIVMTQSALDQYAMAHGFGKTTKEMSEQEKVALRLAFVQSNLANATGDFQRTSGSWANQVRVLTLRFEQFKATIGQSLIAVLLPVVKLLNAIILGATRAAEAFNRMVEQLTGKSMAELTGGAQSAGAAVVGLGDVSQDAAGTAGDLAEAQEQAAKAAKAQDKAQRALNRTLAGFDRINKLASREKAENTSSDAGTELALADAGAALSTIGDTVEGQVEKAQSALDNLTLPPALMDAIGRLRDAFSGLWDTVGSGLQWAWDNILAPFGEWFVNEALPPLVDCIAGTIDILDALLETVGKAFGPIWEELIAPIAELLGDVLVKHWEDVAKVYHEFAAWVREHSDEIAKPFQDLAQLIGEFKDEAIKIKVIAEERGPVEAVKQLFRDILDDKRPLPSRIETTLSAVGSVVGPVAAVKNIFEWAKVNLVPRAAAVIATARGVISEAWGRVQAAFAWAGRKLRSITGTIDAIVNGKMPADALWRKVVDAYAWAKTKLIDKARTIRANVISTMSAGWGEARKQFEWAAKHLKDIKAKISLTLDAAVSNIKDLVNSVIAKINQKLHSLHWPRISVGGMTVGGGQLFPGYSTSSPIPQLAQGGFVGRNTPRLAVIGDNRREGEIVSPESKLQAMADRAAGQAGNAAQLLPVLNAILAAIQAQDRGVYLDGQAITRTVVTGINRQTKSTGRSPLVI